MKKEELVKGNIYWVNFDDCCIQGSFKGAFLGCTVLVSDNRYQFFDAWPLEYEYGQIHFDTGYVDGWAVTFEEIPEQTGHFEFKRNWDTDLYKSPIQELATEHFDFTAERL